MRQRVLLDTGPLVALVDGRDRHHEWAVDQWRETAPPLLTCESVISEACFLLDQTREGSAAVFEMLRRRAVTVAFALDDHIGELQSLRRRYADVPMSVADAALVRMAEIWGQSAVMTLDGDFRVYRKYTRHTIPLILPPDISRRRRR